MIESRFNIKDEDRPLIIAPAIVLVLIVGGLGMIHLPMAQTVGVILGALWVVFVQIHLYRSSVEQRQHAQRQTQALMTLYQTLSFRLPLPSLSGWAITPEFATIIVDIIERNKYRSIVELGSGSSTLIVGYVLEKRSDGRVYSLDHDPRFAEKTRQDIAAHGLESYCRVLDAPIVRQDCGDDEVLYYNTQELDEALRDQIDLLIVDGPPKATQVHARYPAMPLLSKHFADRMTIILDDAARTEETEILERWRKEFPDFIVETIDTVKGAAILRRNTPVNRF